MHEHLFPAVDTSAGGHVYIWNDPTTPNRRVTDLTGLTEDANGSGLSNFYNLVIVGIVNEGGGNVGVLLPSSSYNNNNGDKAVNDDDQTTIYAAAEYYRGTAFLIARLTVQDNAGTFSIVQNEDLRGKFPSSAAGGGVTGGSEFPDTVFRIQDDGDPTKEIAFEASTISTASTRTITVPDHDVKLGSESIIIAMSDENTDMVADGSTALVTFRMPYALTITEIRLSVTTAGTGTYMAADLKQNGTSIFDTGQVVRIDDGEKTSTTASVAYVLATTSLSDDAEITLYASKVGTTIACTGMKFEIIGYQ